MNLAVMPTERLRVLHRIAKHPTKGLVGGAPPERSPAFETGNRKQETGTVTAFINSLELSTRATNVLRNMLDPIDSAEKFLALERDRVLRQPKCGQRTWDEIKQMQDFLRGENIDTETTPQPKHPTVLPDVVAQRLADLARAHGYGIEKLRLVWTTTLGEYPATATVEYDVTARAEEGEA